MICRKMTYKSWEVVIFPGNETVAHTGVSMSFIFRLFDFRKLKLVCMAIDLSVTQRLFVNAIRVDLDTWPARGRIVDKDEYEKPSDGSK